MVVDPADAGQVPSHAFELEDFVDVVFGEPRAVGVPEPVEGEPGQDRIPSSLFVAVDGGDPDAAAEGRAA